MLLDLHRNTDNTAATTTVTDTDAADATDTLLFMMLLPHMIPQENDCPHLSEDFYLMLSMTRKIKEGSEL